ncbi:MAG: hypothetical protein NT058_01325 [Candidatus Portnoybacteria bacterium]|nr:hypothetical protein [Candidatus Portnoybacteria bacterium]
MTTGELEVTFTKKLRNIIVELGEGAFHFEAREHFVGKKVRIVGRGDSRFVGNGFVACTLYLMENICTDEKAGEYMLSGHAFYFPCIKLVKATR